jgi:predicted nucleic acid-binding protein
VSLTIIDADAFVRFERELFDLEGWLEDHPDCYPVFTATVWHQLQYGVHAWEALRSQKRLKRLQSLNFPVLSFGRRHAERAAQVDAQLKQTPIGFADCEIAAVALEEGAELITFNTREFGRVPGIRLATT